MQRFRQSSAAVLIAVAVLSAPSLSGEAPSPADVPLVAEEVRQLMQDRNYAEAVKAIEKASGVKARAQDYLAYLKGRALYLDKQYEKAVETFEQLQKEFPTSPWARRATFAGALALARKGDFRSAELIYRTEAEYLLSEDRKQQLADIYLEFADDYFKPPEEEKKPDYQKALEFYQKALEVGPKPDKRIEVELLAAECHQKLGKMDEAAALYEKFIEDYAEGPLNVEARYRLGQCRLAQGNLKQARRTWQDLLAEHADSPSDRIAEASFQLSRCWKTPKPENDEQLSLGVAALEAFIERFPEHKLASQAHLEIAQSYIHRGRYEDAAESLKRFLADERYGDRKEAPDARNLLGRSYQLQKKFPEALATWRDYLAKHPAHKEWSSVQREIINTEYLMGLEKQTAKQYDDARKLWSAFLAKYPLDGRNPQILYLFGHMNYDQGKWSEAIADWRRLVSKYPKTDPSSRGQYMIAATLEQKLGKLEESLEEYRKVTWGDYAGKAKAAVARLTAKSMTVATERIFRSDETPRLKLTTRNIETVTVRAYKVDLETYFRKMHLARGVENLDIALIDPDKTFEFPVPDYAKYQELESTIEVPIPGGAGSGVMAVTVSSKTLETTTLVIQSDLDVIVKSSRDEVFVFAENMLTGKPWPGARLLISNGRQVFAEGTTGDDGVFHQQYKDLKEAADVRVFATSEGHVASNVVSLKGVGVARGLSEKGYIYTDRPAYRAGQLVHLRGCIRQVAKDAYTIEEGKKYTVEVFDSRNRLVRQEEVTLGEFGSFHLHFGLPATSPQGQYRVLVRDVDDHSFQGTFQVHEYKLEPVHLVVDTPRRVYYRGEQIEGTIRAAFYYGAPLSGREVRYQLADERLHTATTDDKGEIHFKLPTREFAETQVIPLVVMLPERNLQTAVNFVLATRGFAVGVSTVRPVYVAGESFEVTVQANDAEGKPVGRKLTLSVLEKTTVEGHLGERLVEEHQIETAEDDGSARQTLTLAKGGRYVLRVEGTDRFKNPISGESLVQISGDEDKVRLRILADRHTFKVGDTAGVRLHWREAPALALVTFQGARVLDYKLVVLQKGSNKFEIPMTARLAPNFELAVAVMTDPRPADGNEKAGDKPVRRFHTASSPFTVQRDLRLSVSCKRTGDAKGPVRPGEEVRVTLRSTDPQGKPVAAEVSLAMIEQSLLERFAWPVPPIADFFRGQPRQPAVRTTSSITFAYSPSTRRINPQLLTEQDRLEVAREEELSIRLGTRVYAAADLVAPVDRAAEVAGEAPFAAERTREAYDEDSEEEAARGLARAERLRRSTSDRRGTAIGREAQSLQMMVNPQIIAGGRYGAGMGGYGGLGQQQSGAFSANANFDTLIDLVTTTIQPDAWGGAGNLGSVAPFPTNLNVVIRQSQTVHGVNVLQPDGTQQDFSFFIGFRHGGEAQQKRAQELIAELAEAGAVLLPALGPQETGYWNPAVVTGEDGTATVTFHVPDRSTGWTLMAKGITTETLAGEGTEDLVVKKDLFGELKLPLAFTDGDEAEVPISVHNDAVEKGQIDVTLKTTIAGRSVEEKKTLDVDAKGIHELAFKTVLRRPEKAETDADDPGAADVDVVFELTVTAGDRSDVVRRAIPLLPYGMPVFATASGSATSDTTAWVEAPPEMPFDAPSLEILVGPTVERSLLDIVLGPAPSCQVYAHRFASGLDSATSDLMASLGLMELLGTSREAGGPQAQAIDARVRASVSLLVSSQNEDGGWSWTGRGEKSDRYGSARIVWALSLARSAGYTVPDDCFNKAIGYLRNQVAAVQHSDYESQAILLSGLAAAGRGDFALANRLYRSRPALSSAALAHLALAFAKMERKSTAAELLDLLRERDLDDAALRRQTAQGSLPWSHSPAELRALYALALQEVTPRAPKAKELVDWLLAHRTGHRWAPDKATGVAALALCRWFAESRFEGEHYSLAVFVNDVQAEVLEIKEGSGTQTIDVPGELLRGGKQRINFQITGRGRYTYQCVLAGFVPADKLKSTTSEWYVRRIYEPAPLEMDGREIPRGFGVLTGSYSTFRNPLTQLPVARRGLVELEVRRRNISSNTPEEQLEYLVITEPIPSGTTVIEDSVTGGFERFEISPGAITFYVGSRRYVGDIHYQLRGYLPGKFRAGPTQIRNAYRPEQLAVFEPKPLEVLPLGATSSDEYRLTPQELYELGKRHFEQGNLQIAGKHLAELVDKWNLKTEVYKDSVEKLLDVHLAIGPPAKIVHYFEIIKEKWPQQEIPFDKIVKVGAAYHEMGEYERSYLVFRATVESSFTRESGVAGFLESQGEFLRSVDVMGRLLAEYPPEAYVAAATYALAQRVYAKAPEAAADAKLREKKVNRVDLVRRAWAMLEGFLTAYPEDPAADQAAFATANALLELEAYQEATDACNRYARRYPKSDLLDSYWYMIGYCHFATGKHQAALEMCRKVAEATRIDKATGREVESRNKWRAIYILGQVYHSLGRAADAIREYRRVDDRFADAKEAIEYFIHKAIKLPEVTTVKPGEPVEVKLDFRNIAACDAKVYRIDLMKFSLLKRSLGGITNINLAGIRPYHETTVKLGDGKDYRDRTHKLPLPLKEEGAYLVVCRGENLHTSGLVLITPLAVEVSEDVPSGRVRSTVKDLTADRYVSEVHVKVIGSRNSEFISGSTDLRGVFVADGIQGTSTVIAQLDPSRYAFFRGQTELGPPPEAARAEPQSEAAATKKPEAKGQPAASLKQQLLKGLQDSNVEFQRRQVEQLQQMYESEEEGVAAEKAF